VPRKRFDSPWPRSDLNVRASFRSRGRKLMAIGRRVRITFLEERNAQDAHRNRCGCDRRGVPQSRALHKPGAFGDVTRASVLLPPARLPARNSRAWLNPMAPIMATGLPTFTRPRRPITAQARAAFGAINGSGTATRGAPSGCKPATESRSAEMSTPGTHPRRACAFLQHPRAVAPAGMSPRFTRLARSIHPERLLIR
jgi:hypothetical protein